LNYIGLDRSPKWRETRNGSKIWPPRFTQEDLLWFQPPVWLLGTRLMDERERACDEEVLVMGSETEA